MTEGQGQEMICSLLGFVYLWNQETGWKLERKKEADGLIVSPFDVPEER